MHTNYIQNHARDHTQKLSHSRASGIQTLYKIQLSMQIFLINLENAHIFLEQSAFCFHVIVKNEPGIFF